MKFLEKLSLSHKAKIYGKKKHPHYPTKAHIAEEGYYDGFIAGTSDNTFRNFVWFIIGTTIGLLTGLVL